MQNKITLHVEEPLAFTKANETFQLDITFSYGHMPSVCLSTGVFIMISLSLVLFVDAAPTLIYRELVPNSTENAF